MLGPGAIGHLAERERDTGSSIMFRPRQWGYSAGDQRQDLSGYDLLPRGFASAIAGE